MNVCSIVACTIALTIALTSLPEDTAAAEDPVPFHCLTISPVAILLCRVGGIFIECSADSHCYSTRHHIQSSNVSISIKIRVRARVRFQLIDGMNIDGALCAPKDVITERYI